MEISSERIGKPSNITERMKTDHENINSIQEEPQPSKSLEFF